jgi:hypothetical protein
MIDIVTNKGVEFLTAFLKLHVVAQHSVGSEVPEAAL